MFEVMQMNRLQNAAWNALAELSKDAKAKRLLNSLHEVKSMRACERRRVCDRAGQRSSERVRAIESGAQDSRLFFPSHRSRADICATTTATARFCDGTGLAQRDTPLERQLNTFMDAITREPRDQSCHARFSRACAAIGESSRFSILVVLAIVVVGIIEVLNVEKLGSGFGKRLTGNVILAIFTFECVIKICAEHRRPWRYFIDSWNKVDRLG